jgi:hypothetical protein
LLHQAAPILQKEVSAMVKKLKKGERKLMAKAWKHKMQDNFKSEDLGQSVASSEDVMLNETSNEHIQEGQL